MSPLALIIAVILS